VTAPVRLTAYSHGAGCACKLGPGDLAAVLELLGPTADDDPNLLVGYGTSDDAGVYRVRDDLALVFTTDFFTPIVDDAYDWGRIAATNALSDVYAMGAVPLMVLNLVAWPREGLPAELLADVLRGGRDVAKAAGAALVGGHSIDDAEPKYGMAVVGTADPDRLIRNDAGRPGDLLVLTKPLGTGVASTALKQDRVPAAVMVAAVEVMTTLNAAAATTALEHGVRAGTDVTGFGLLGHLRELAVASGCSAEVTADEVPLIPGVAELVEAGMVAGGTRRNRDHVESSVRWGGTPETLRWLLCDAQTSGGLLLAVPEAAVGGLVSTLEAAGTPAASVVGRLVAGEPGAIAVS